VEQPVTATQADTRTLGQVAYEASFATDNGDQSPWSGLGKRARDGWTNGATAVIIAHYAAQRAARGEVMVDKSDLRTVLDWCRGQTPKEVTSQVHRLRARLVATEASANAHNQKENKNG
jgi:hypothetical protein